MKKNYSFTLKTFSPIHIGSGLLFEPTNSIVLARTSQNNLTNNVQPRCPKEGCNNVLVFNPKMGKYFCPKHGFAIEQPQIEHRQVNNVGESCLYTFSSFKLSKIFDQNERLCLENIACQRENSLKNLKEFFIKNKEKIKSVSQKRSLVKVQGVNGKDISQVVFDKVKGCAFVPGSSLKGDMLSILGIPKNFGEGSRIRSQYSFSDCYGENNGLTEVVFAKNFPINQRYREKSWINEYLEVIPKDSVFKGSFICEENEFARICNQVNTSYINLINRQRNVLSQFKSLFENLVVFANQPKHILLRVGKHCGIDKDIYWYSEQDNLPFGWVGLSFE